MANDEPMRPYSEKPSIFGPRLYMVYPWTYILELRHRLAVQELALTTHTLGDDTTQSGFTKFHVYTINNRLRFTIRFHILLTPTATHNALARWRQLERDHMAEGVAPLINHCSVLLLFWTELFYCSHVFLPTDDVCFELISPRLTNLGKGVRSALGIWV